SRNSLVPTDCIDCRPKSCGTTRLRSSLPPGSMPASAAAPPALTWCECPGYLLRRHHHSSIQPNRQLSYGWNPSGVEAAGGLETVVTWTPNADEECLQS